MTVDEQLTGWYTLTRQARRPDQIVRAYSLLGDAVCIDVEDHQHALHQSKGFSQQLTA